MRINHNIAALNTYRQFGAANAEQTKSMEKLSSGLRINRAGDDAAGLAISEKMRGQIRGLDMASKNAQDGVSLIQTAEGALNETHSILQRMRELAVQSTNDTNTADDRAELQKEVTQLKEEIDRIANNTEFNTQKLLNGDLSAKTFKDDSATVTSKTGDFAVTVSTTGIGNGTAGDGVVTADDTFVIKITEYDATNDQYKYEITSEAAGTTVAGAAPLTNAAAQSITVGGGVDVDVDVDKMKVGDSFTVVTRKEQNDAGGVSGELTFQIGSNSNQTLNVGIDSMKTADLHISNVDVSSAQQATAAISSLDDAIKSVSAERSKLGAYQNRLEHTINNLGTSSENLTAAESRVRDVDMAKEMMNQTKNSILSQAAQAMLAQANQQPQGVLQLLR